MKKIVIVMSCVFVAFTALPLKSKLPKSTTFPKSTLETGEGVPLNLNFISRSNLSSNGVLIFLDDSGQEGPGVLLLARAIAEKASPLIVSASLIPPLSRVPDEIQYEPLDQRFSQLTQLPRDKVTRETTSELLKLIPLLMARFTAQKQREWIIKEINPSLYLLLHESYVGEKTSSVELVRRYDEQAPLTLTEIQLGLKVNHMKTVEAADIKTPTPKPIVASYFTQALKENSIFVTNAEYPAQFAEFRAPWSIFMVGHGSPERMVAGVSLEDFRDFLSFLENKIRTKLLYYVSCFSGGKNESLLYATSQAGVNKTYPFALITQSVSDNSVATNPYNISFSKFLQHVRNNDLIDYFALAECINLAVHGIKDQFPKIKFPGLEWFSVIDEKKVVSIGSVLAKTRTKPLNIGTDLKKEGKKQEGPLAILLYAKEIPFELKINSGGSQGKPPLIISMVPGDALHTIKRISSSVYSADNITANISSFPFLGAHKTFVIGEIEGPIASSSAEKSDGVSTSSPSFTTPETAIKEWVVVDRYVDKKLDTLYFVFGKKNHAMHLSQFPPILEPWTDVLNYNYIHILQEAVKEQRKLLVDQARKFFEKSHFSFEACLPTIMNFYFFIMPSNYVLYIPKIILSSEITNMDYLADRLGTALCKVERGEGKQIWFGEVVVEGKEGVSGGVNLRLGVAKDGSKSFVASANFLKETSCGRVPVQRVETIPTPAAEKAIETSSIHTHTTEDTVKVLTGLLAKKEALEAYLREYLQDAFRKGTEWIKRGEKWVQAQPSLRE